MNEGDLVHDRLALVVLPENDLCNKVVRCAELRRGGYLPLATLVADQRELIAPSNRNGLFADTLDLGGTTVTVPPPLSTEAIQG
ncbi:MAG: hypothetical protein IPH15_06585 [Comamonadaceae bacterium]|nr:hypothetical protein [Comamonadaceae bacterium]